MVRLGTMALFVFATALGGILLTLAGHRIASLWLANAGALAIVLRSPRPERGALYVVGFLANVVANLAVGDHSPLAVAIAGCNLLEVWLCVRLLGPLDLGAGTHMTVPHLFRFLGVGLLAPALSAIPAGLLLAFASDQAAGAVMGRWFIADALGLLTLTPLLLSVRRSDLLAIGRPRAALEAVAIIGLTGAITAFVFWQEPRPLLFVILPPLMLAAFRLRFAGTGAALILVALIATPLTVAGHGPIAHNFADTIGRIWFLQLFLAVSTFATVPIASILADRARLMAELVAGQHRYRELADHSKDMIVRIGPNGALRYVSPASRQVLGFEPAELIAAPSGESVHPDDRQRVMATFQQVLERRGNPVCTFRRLHRDGSYAWLEAACSLIADPETGEPVEIVASMRNVTHRKANEEMIAAATQRLADSHRLLTMAEQIAGIGHWRIDIASGKVVWSREVFRIYGLDPVERVHIPDGVAAYVPEDQPLVEAYVKAAMEDGTPFAFAGRLVRSDGAVRHVMSQGQPERAADGTITGVVGVFQDITAEVEAQAELIAARDEAQAAAEARSAFLAMMSHEIRTPMTGVLGMIELLRSEPPAAERARFFASLEQSAQLLMTVLDDVLDFSKIESGQLTTETVDFDVRELVQTTLDLFHNAASRKGLLVALDYRAGRTAAMRQGDPTRLQQIVSNLVSNAVKFTESGSIILRAVPPTSGDRWRFEVRDTGIGISPDVTDRLFQPFIQADVSTTRRFGGTGLGLAISRRLVEAMGGVMGVESKPGRGSTFWFELDLPEGSAAATPIEAEPVLPAGRPLSVLLTEDNEINQLLVSTLLRRMGHSVQCAANGRIALEAVQRQAFDVVLMDVQMPEMDGLAATRAIRALGGDFATLPIIALTADASPERRRFHEGAGFTDFMTKPVHSALLERRLAAIGGAGQGAPIEAPPPAPFAAGSPALVDGRIADLTAAVGPGIVAQMLDMLVDEARTRPAAIRALAPADPVRARAEAHGLKGAASSIGAIPLAEAAAAVEDAYDDALLPAIEALEAAAAMTLAALETRPNGGMAVAS